MRHGALVEAALLDQERRILASTPQEIRGDKRGRGPGAATRAPCDGGCGRWQYRSCLGRCDSYRCQRCFPRAKAKAVLPGPRCDRPQCNGRRLQRNRWGGNLYCSGRNHRTG